ncbi:hypothetical protein [Xenorhabdus sp. TS4]|uniref:hypothetical protein n=1 Tax=Xenorhabdus sp. TS4 TaxID=1873483 RepID=UPI001656FB66|nr:hypothetical protein [Xenorhabdus sp. TS4]MBC8951084.1 hypothetical protein [Xenorhabdus sp. TS4]
MGQGGYITLVNSTNSNWNKSDYHSYQMNSWDFPETIAAKSSAKIYVEWSQGFFENSSDDSGEVTYTLENTSNVSFQIQSRAKNGFGLQVYFSNLETSGNTKGSTLKLGWNHDGIVNFLLSGREGEYTASNLDAFSWMNDNISLLGNKKLRNICMAGSHDAGMSIRNSGTPFAFECNTLTQSCDILGQLNLGARYFDIRPVISGGHYYTGHYGYVEAISSWQGSNGQSIPSIIDNINEFTASRNELVILNFSHSLNTDVGNDSYRSFTRDEWDGLLNQLTSIKKLFITKNTDLTSLTLNDFISDGPSVLLIFEDEHVQLGDKENKGFYYHSCFNAYNEYANSDNVSYMSEDQIEKMNREMPSNYFLLSWTLTQNNTQASTCCTALASSIKQLANKVNQELAYRLYPAISENHYPNIIFVDYIDTSEAAAMAMAVNWFIHG